MITLEEVFDEFCAKIGGKAIKSRRICYFDFDGRIIYFQFIKKTTEDLRIMFWVGCEDTNLSKLYAKSIDKPYKKLTYPAFKMALMIFKNYIRDGKKRYQKYVGESVRSNFMDSTWHFNLKNYPEKNMLQMLEISNYILREFKSKRIDIIDILHMRTSYTPKFDDNGKLEMIESIETPLFMMQIASYYLSRNYEEVRKLLSGVKDYDYLSEATYLLDVPKHRQYYDDYKCITYFRNLFPDIDATPSNK